jgi:hypothetical protein
MRGQERLLGSENAIFQYQYQKQRSIFDGRIHFFAPRSIYSDKVMASDGGLHK